MALSWQVGTQTVRSRRAHSFFFCQRRSLHGFQCVKKYMWHVWGSLFTGKLDAREHKCTENNGAAWGHTKEKVLVLVWMNTKTKAHARCIVMGRLLVWHIQIDPSVSSAAQSALIERTFYKEQGLSLRSELLNYNYWLWEDIWQNTNIPTDPFAWFDQSCIYFMLDVRLWISLLSIYCSDLDVELSRHQK